MRRRVVLAELVGVGVIGQIGCLDVLGDDCPDPDIERPLEYETTDLGRVPLEAGPATTVRLYTTDEDTPDPEPLGEDAIEWIEETDFEAQVVVDARILTGNEADAPTVLGVGRVDGNALRVYSCVADRGHEAAAELHAILLRVRTLGTNPNEAALSHWVDGDWKRY